MIENTNDSKLSSALIPEQPKTLPEEHKLPVLEENLDPATTKPTSVVFADKVPDHLAATQPVNPETQEFTVIRDTAQKAPLVASDIEGNKMPVTTGDPNAQGLIANQIKEAEAAGKIKPEESTNLIYKILGRLNLLPKSQNK